jgi:hypothetical protein
MRPKWVLSDEERTQKYGNRGRNNAKTKNNTTESIKKTSAVKRSYNSELYENDVQVNCLNKVSSDLSPMSKMIKRFKPTDHYYIDYADTVDDQIRLSSNCIDMKSSKLNTNEIQLIHAVYLDQLNSRNVSENFNFGNF